MCTRPMDLAMSCSLQSPTTTWLRVASPLVDNRRGRFVCNMCMFGLMGQPGFALGLGGCVDLHLLATDQL